MLELEKKLTEMGLQRIVGLDEAGRGSLAGPVVAAALAVKKTFKMEKIFKGINDSKKLNEKKREEFYEKLIHCSDIYWNIGKVSSEKIDQLNILEATKIAMRRAVQGIGLKMKASPDCLLIDGNFEIDSGIDELPIIKGDEFVFSCMAAGIVAKVSRDRMMKNYCRKYPQYFFEKNKGYGTALHIEAIKKVGYCPIHRKTFKCRVFHQSEPGYVKPGFTYSKKAKPRTGRSPV